MQIVTAMKTICMKYQTYFIAKQKIRKTISSSSDESAQKMVNVKRYQKNGDHFHSLKYK